MHNVAQQHPHRQAPTTTRAIYESLLLNIAEWARSPQPSDFMSTYHHQQPDIEPQDPIKMTHASSSPHQPRGNTETGSSSQCQENGKGCENSISYASARVLEEGLAECEKGVRGEGKAERLNEQKNDDDTEDHPNLRLQWTWTALRR